MDCRQYQEALGAAALGQQSSAEVQAFRLHLEICEDCRRELARRSEFLGALDQHLRTQFEAGTSADFNARLRRRIASEPRQIFRPSWQWLPTLAGAAALAALLVLFHYHYGSTPHARNSNSVPDALSGERLSPSAPPGASSLAPPQERAGSILIPSQRPMLHPVSANRPAARALEVRIDRHELHAVVRLSRYIADGRVNTTALLDSDRQPDEPVAAKPLDIPPLELKPIENSALESDAGER